MPLDDLPSQLIVPGRDVVANDYTEDYQLRSPGAGVGPGTQPWIDGQCIADALATLYSDARIIANAASRQTRTGTQLDNIDGVDLGEPRNPPQGASGSVLISAGPTGTTIQQGDVCVINGFKFRCTATDDYADGDPVPVTGIDVGPGTNTPPGTQGKWSAPRPGCYAPVTVNKQFDNTGLSGGALVESDPQYVLRLDERAQNPPASGNDAEYIDLVEKTLTVAVQQGYTVPGVRGPGSICVFFTLRPSQPGANRLPNATQTAAVLAWIKGQFPATDGIYMGTLIANPVNVNMRALWQVGGAGWADQQPWPPYVSGTQIAVDGTKAISPTSFSLTGNNGTNPAPLPGQTIGLFDLGGLQFRQKKILTVTAVSTTWLLTVDTSSGASDTSYSPFGGQIVGPWSDSLGSLSIPVVSYFDGLGPGEQYVDSDFIDPGLRQHRSPPSPQFFPSEVGNRIVKPLFDIPNVGDVALLDPAIPYAAPIGAPGVSAYVTTLGNFAVFKE